MLSIESLEISAIVNAKHTKLYTLKLKVSIMLHKFEIENNYYSLLARIFENHTIGSDPSPYSPSMLVSKH